MRALPILAATITALSLWGAVWTAQAEPPLQQCATQPSGAQGSDRQRSSSPECGLEITCTDKSVLLGYPKGVCFRATCPGIWGLIHSRADQASFRRRLFSYRHYSFKGYWDLKDQGVIEAGAAPIRELFLVLPDDLIELKLTDPDCYAKVEIRNLGYIKTGNVRGLQEWLAYNSYMEKVELNGDNRTAGPAQSSGCLTGTSWLDRACAAGIGGALSVGKIIGLPIGGR